MLVPLNIHSQRCTIGKRIKARVFSRNAVSRGPESGIEVLLISTKLYFRASYNTRHCFLPDFSPRRSRFTRYPLPRAQFIRGLFTSISRRQRGNVL